MPPCLHFRVSPHLVSLADEGGDATLGPGPGCAPCAMQVVHGVHREIEIHHVIHPTWNIQPPAHEIARIRGLGSKNVHDGQCTTP